LHFIATLIKLNILNLIVKSNVTEKPILLSYFLYLAPQKGMCFLQLLL